MYPTLTPVGCPSLQYKLVYVQNNILLNKWINKIKTHVSIAQRIRRVIKKYIKKNFQSWRVTSDNFYVFSELTFKSLLLFSFETKRKKSQKKWVLLPKVQAAQICIGRKVAPLRTVLQVGFNREGYQEWELLPHRCQGAVFWKKRKMICLLNAHYNIIT